MNDYKEFDKYLDFGTSSIQPKEYIDEKPNKICQEEKEVSKEDKSDDDKKEADDKAADKDAQAGEPQYFNQRKFSDEEKKALEDYKNYIEGMQARMQTPEFQEMIKKRNDLFSPKVERLFAGYLLLRGFITEEQAKEYLRKMIPHDGEDNNIEPERFEDVPEELKKKKLDVTR